MERQRESEFKGQQSVIYCKSTNVYVSECYATIKLRIDGMVTLSLEFK